MNPHKYNTHPLLLPTTIPDDHLRSHHAWNHGASCLGTITYWKNGNNYLLE